MFTLSLIIGLCLTIHSSICAEYVVRNEDSYDTLKQNILNVESEWRFGGKLELTENDGALNDIYKTVKRNLLETGFENEARFSPSKYFLTNPFEHDPTDDIYKIIRRLPKAGLLHAHQSATYDLNTFPQFMFSLDNCRICETEEGAYRLHYFDDGVQDYPEEYVCRACPTEYAENYDDEVQLARKHMSMYDGSDYSDSTIQTIWGSFEGKFAATGDAKDTFHVWVAMLREGIKLLLADNIQYVEFRTGFGDRRHRNGTYVPFEDLLKIVEDEVATFREENANFYGIRFIFTKSRVGLSDSNLVKKLDGANELYQNSTLARGFDIVSSEEEEESRTLKSVAGLFNKWRNDTGSDMPFAFHAGETSWTGFKADENVIDAVLLGTKRIGHGYALDAHPLIVEMVREQEIGIELNPISNQVLALVDDIRNHRNKRLMDVANAPGLLSDKPLRFSVNSDDCLFFGSKPITDDMYAVVMAMTAKSSGLEVIKQLAYDSIETSLLDEDEKEELTFIFEQEWDRVVVELIAQFEGIEVLPEYEDGAGVDINESDNELFLEWLMNEASDDDEKDNANDESKL